MPFDILPALEGEDSPMGNSRLRVSSVLKYAFAWNVSGRLPIMTGGVLSSAYSRVKAAFPPGCAGRGSRERCSLVIPRERSSLVARGTGGPAHSRKTLRVFRTTSTGRIPLVLPRSGIQPTGHHGWRRPSRYAVDWFARICYPVGYGRKASLPAKLECPGGGTPVRHSMRGSGMKVSNSSPR